MRLIIIMRFIIILLLLYFCHINAMLADVEIENLNYYNNPDSFTKIVGGNESTPGAWPWMGVLRIRNSSPLYISKFCGAALIHPKWAITASHCVENLYAGEIEIVMGIFDLKNDSGQNIRISKIIMHPDYDNYTYDSDIALLELSSLAQYEPIQLISENNSLEGLTGTITGWGKISEFSASSDVLREVSIPIVSNQTCQAVYLYDNITDNMLCAGCIEGGKDACQGDSGGPLMVKENNIWKLAGIISWGEGCALPGFFGVYTRVLKFIDFIGKYVPITKISGNISTNISAFENYIFDNTIISIKGTNYITHCDQSGFFYFYLPYGNYSFLFQAKYFKPMIININLSKRQEIHLNPELEFFYGDINGNGKIDLKDIIKLLKLLGSV